MRGTLAERFWAKVEKTDTCWLWTGSKSSDGYGRIFVKGKSPQAAHRVSYLMVAEIPEGFQLDHLCRVTSCVNPDHLEPVTNRENTLRGRAPQKARETVRLRALSRTHCKHGHLFDQENTYITPRGWRQCLVCKRAAKKRFDTRLKGVEA